MRSDWSILFVGPVGSGKTTAVHALSDQPVAQTEVLATDETAQIKSHTTVAMDVGEFDLGNSYTLRLLGAPGQERFDFMWDILLEQANAVVILVDHSKPTPLQDLDYYLNVVAQRSEHRQLPAIVAITHTDHDAAFSPHVYREHLLKAPPSFACAMVPVMAADARKTDDIKRLVICLTAILEMEQRFGQ